MFYWLILSMKLYILCNDILTTSFIAKFCKIFITLIHFVMNFLYYIEFSLHII